MKLIALALIAGCYTGTTVPGLRRCSKLYFPFGYVENCEEGPPWEKVNLAPPPPPAPPAPVIGPARWCAEMAGCSPTKEACVEAEKQAGRSGLGCREMHEVSKP